MSNLISQIPQDHLDPRPYGSWIWAVDYPGVLHIRHARRSRVDSADLGLQTAKIAKKACMFGSIVYAHTA